MVEQVLVKNTLSLLCIYEMKFFTTLTPETDPIKYLEINLHFVNLAILDHFMKNDSYKTFLS